MRKRLQRAGRKKLPFGQKKHSQASCYVTAAEMKKLDNQAAVMGISRSTLIRMVIEEYLL